ncbi:MAG: hypothetical protein QM705_15010 [Ancrocorticia sp.]
MYSDNPDVNNANTAASPAETNVLFVCTGNICRSPVGELVLNSLALPGVHARSAGTSALVGEEIDPSMRQMLEQDGIPAQHFRARQLSAAIIQHSDIIVTAAGEHRGVVLREAPGALRRTFTLRELADLTELAEQNGPIEPLERKARLAQLVRLRSLRSPDALNDIEDPYRLSDVHYREAYQTISESVRGPLARLLTSFLN